MRKKLMAMLLCVAMLLTLVPTMAFAFTDPTAATNLVYNGKAQRLLATNGDADLMRSMRYSVDSDSLDSGSVPTKMDAGTYTVYYGQTKMFGTTLKGNVVVTIDKATLTAENVTAADAMYTGNAYAGFSVKIGSTELPAKDHDATYYTFADDGYDDGIGQTDCSGEPIVGTPTTVGNYVVKVEGKGNCAGTVYAKFEITKANDPFAVAAVAEHLDYNNAEQALVKVVTVPVNGTLSYAVVEKGASAPADGAYTAEIPTEKDPGEYTVYWKYAQTDKDNYVVLEGDKIAGSVDVTIDWPEVVDTVTVFAEGASASITGKTGTTDDPKDYDYKWEVVYGNGSEDAEDDVVSLGANTTSQIVGVSGLKEGRAILKETYTYNGFYIGQKPSYTEYYTVIVLPAVRKTIDVQVGKTGSLDGESGINHSWSAVPASSEGSVEFSREIRDLPHYRDVTGVAVGPVLVEHTYWTISLSPKLMTEHFLVNVVKGDGNAKIVKTTEELTFNETPLTLATVEKDSNTGDVTFAVVPTTAAAPTSCRNAAATATNAGSYNVFYEVAESDNYNAKGVTYACTVDVAKAQLQPPPALPVFVEAESTSNSATFTVNADDVGNNNTITNVRHWTLQYSIDGGKSWHDVTTTKFTVNDLTTGKNDYQIVLRKHVRNDDTNHTDSAATAPQPFSTSTQCVVTFVDDTVKPVTQTSNIIDVGAKLGELPDGPMNYLDNGVWYGFQNWYKSSDKEKTALAPTDTVGESFTALPNMVAAKVYKKVDGFVGNGEYLIVSGNYAMGNTIDTGLFAFDSAVGIDISANDAVSLEDDILIFNPNADTDIVWNVTVTGENSAKLAAKNGQNLNANYALGYYNLGTTNAGSSAWTLTNGKLYYDNIYSLRMNDGNFFAAAKSNASEVTLYALVDTNLEKAVLAENELTYTGNPCALEVRGDLATVDAGKYTATYSVKDSEEDPTDVAPKDAGEYVVYLEAKNTVAAGDFKYTGETYLYFKINPAPITVTPNELSKNVGKADPTALTYTVEPALFTGDSFTGALLREEGEDPGKYEINQDTLSAGDNYKITFTTGKYFTINPQVTYHANGGTFAQGVESVVYPNYETSLVEKGPTKTNKVFAGWYTDSACTKSWNFEDGVTANLDLYAKWVDAEYTVEVSVTKNNDFWTQPTVALKRGGEVVASEPCTGSGNVRTYTFENVPAGNYTLEVFYDAYNGENFDATQTVAITVDKDLTGDNKVEIALQSGKHYTVTVEPGTPDTAVAGIKSAVTTSGTNSVEVKVASAAAYNADVIAIKGQQGSSNAVYLDITVKKNGTEDVHETNMLTFTVEYPTDGRTNFTVYRYHDDEVEKMTKDPAGGAEGFVVGNGCITIYAKEFSVYAIASDNIVYGGGGGGGVSTYAVNCGTGVTADKKTASAGAKVTLTVSEGYENIVVKDAKGNAVTVSGNTFEMPASDVTVSVSKKGVATTYDKCGKGDDCVLKAFNDVDTWRWYHDGVHYCLDNGVMNGIGNGEFAPTASTTRGMIFTVLARLDGVTITSTGNEWYTDGQAWSVKVGVSDGTDPTGSITREQLAAMFYRYAKLKGYDVAASGDLTAYGDNASVSAYAVDAMKWAVGAGIIKGDKNNLKPTTGATRVEVATMLMRFCETVVK